MEADRISLDVLSNRTPADRNMTHTAFVEAYRRLFALTAAIVLAATGALAQESPVYEGPVPVPVDGRRIEVPVRITGETLGGGREIVLHAYADADDLKPALLALTQDLAKKIFNRCELRFSVADASMRTDTGRLILTIRARTEIWVCSSFLKTRLGREMALVQASVIPGVIDGRLHLEPSGLSISGISDILREVGGEAVMQLLFSEIVDRFNEDPRLNLLPKSLSDAGFAYSDVQAFGGDALRVSITGPNDLIGLWKRVLGAR
jgi:hypothetical protein